MKHWRNIYVDPAYNNTCFFKTLQTASFSSSHCRYLNWLSNCNQKFKRLLLLYEVHDCAKQYFFFINLTVLAGQRVLRDVLTDSDGLRGTFWPVKFWPPNFFMKSSLIYPINHGEGKKSHLWAFWGLRGAKKPKSRNCHFWAKIFVFSYRKSSTT